MGIVIDIVIIVFILASIILGYKKGLVSLGIQLLAFVIAIIITFILYKPVGNLIINSTQIDEKLQTSIATKVSEAVSNDSENKLVGGIIEDAKNGMLEEGSKTLSMNIIYGGTMILLFIISRVCLVFINALANAISKLPILNQFNKLGGLIYGGARGLLITYVVLMIINLIITLNPTSGVKKAIDDTYIAKTMCEHNILNVFFK